MLDASEERIRSGKPALIPPRSRADHEDDDEEDHERRSTSTIGEGNPLYSKFFNRARYRARARPRSMKVGKGSPLRAAGWRELALRRPGCR
jgi:hypothetical protein